MFYTRVSSTHVYLQLYTVAKDGAVVMWECSMNLEDVKTHIRGCGKLRRRKKTERTALQEAALQGEGEENDIGGGEGGGGEGEEVEMEEGEGGEVEEGEDEEGEGGEVEEGGNEEGEGGEVEEGEDEGEGGEMEECGNEEVEEGEVEAESDSDSSDGGGEERDVVTMETDKGPFCNVISMQTII